MDKDLKAILERMLNGGDSAILELRQKYYLDNELERVLNLCIKYKGKTKVKIFFDELAEKMFFKFNS